MRRSQQGIGLIEILVSLLLLAIAILGFVALQVQSIKATGESVDRIKALSIMEGMAEKVRLNSTVVNKYQSEFHNINSHNKLEHLTKPSNMCGLDGKMVSTPCSRDNIAIAEVYLFALQIKNTNLVMDIVNCPRNTSTGGVLNSKCMIASWNNTTPTVGSNADSDCLKSDGKYHTKASCVFMEIN